VHDSAGHIRETEIPASVTKCQAFVIETEQMQERRVQVMHVHFILNCR
jgi:hypothetical protein